MKFDYDNNSGGITGDVFNMEPRVINGGGQSYDLNADVENTVGKVTFSPRDLADLDQKINSGWWAQQNRETQAQHSTEQQQPAPRLDYKSHPDFDNALKKIRSQNRFEHNGKEYFKYGDATYQVQNSIPNIGKRLSPEEANSIDNVRARLQMDLPIENTDGPFGPISAAIATAGVSIAGGSTLAAGALKGARSLLGRSIWDFTK